MKIARKLRYASRTEFFELELNGEYQGLYLLMEKIKRGDDRVDIHKLGKSDISGDELTGGYILKIDKEDPEDDGFESSITPPSVVGSQGLLTRAALGSLVGIVPVAILSK